MTERSFIWDSGGSGDSSPHSEANTALLFGAILGDRLISANKGVLRGVLNALTPSSPGAGQVRIASGAAISDGHPYVSDANVDFTPTTPSVGTTGHRIVLRASWSAQTVRLVDISSADGTAAIPAMTQTPGTTYDIPICSFTKSTGGVIASLTDTREFAGSPTDPLEAVLQSIVNTTTGIWKGMFWAPGAGVIFEGSGQTAPGSLNLRSIPGNGSNNLTVTTLSDGSKGMGELRTSGVSNDDIGFYTQWGIDPLTDNFEMGVVCYIDNDTNREIFFGLSTTTNPSDGNSRIGIRVINNGNLICFADNAGAETTVDTGAGGSAAPGTLYALKIVGSAGSISFFVNGNAYGPITTNIMSAPSATYPMFGMRSTTAAQDKLPWRDFSGRMKAA